MRIFSVYIRKSTRYQSAIYLRGTNSLFSNFALWSCSSKFTPKHFIKAFHRFLKPIKQPVFQSSDPILSEQFKNHSKYKYHSDRKRHIQKQHGRLRQSPCTYHLPPRYESADTGDRESNILQSNIFLSFPLLYDLLVLIKQIPPQSIKKPPTISNPLLQFGIKFF